VAHAEWRAPHRKAFFLRFFRRKAERGGVDAVAQAGGRGAVVEDVGQVGVALAAQRLGAAHEQAVIGLGAHVLRGGRRPETRPAGTGLKLFVAAEQGVAAAHAAIHTGFVIIPVAAGKGALGTLLACYGKLFRREFFLPFGIGLDDFVLPSLPKKPVGVKNLSVSGIRYVVLSYWHPLL
jgi:hypothetical protein